MITTVKNHLHTRSNKTAPKEDVVKKNYVTNKVMSMWDANVLCEKTFSNKKDTLKTNSASTKWHFKQ